MKVAVAQINPTVGDLVGNSRMIREIIQNNNGKCDLIIFPEMCLTGYPPQDLLLDTSFLEKTEQELYSILQVTKSIPVILGTVRKEGKQLYNTAAVLQNSEVIAFRDKTHLPTYDVFDEDRYFEIATSRQPVAVTCNGNKVQLGIQICEDLWDADYDIKVSQELIESGAEILINISASPFHLNRMSERLNNIKDKCKYLKCYFIYCNLVGAQDELVFDGNSCIMDSHARLISLLPAFATKVQVVNLYNCSPISYPKYVEEEQIFYALSLGVKDYFQKTGHNKAVLGLSGGIDSALTAVIAKEAIGAKNVLGISMPSVFSSDHSIADAKALAENLGIDFTIISIKEINKQILADLSSILNGSPAGLAEENLQARIRGNILMAVANKREALLLNTGNKTETALGYCTMYGDMAGALAVISDLNKSTVYALSKWINEHYNNEVIPESSISKAPSAELKPNQIDPFDYEKVSPLVDKIISEPYTISSLKQDGYPAELISEIIHRIRISEYKRRQAAPGIRVSSKAFGIGRRYPIVNKFDV